MVAAVTTDASQAVVIAAAAFPADSTDASQVDILAATESSVVTYASQVAILVAVRGRVNDPVVRAWTFSLDGHDFYVLRLGNIKTLVYDTLSKEWYNWGSGTSDLWKAYQGTNWLGGDGFAYTYGSNVVVGDDANGSLYFLDPDGETDDDNVFDDTTNTFERIIQTQLLAKGYDKVPCYGILLEGSIGQVDDDTLTSVQLEVSDDKGETYTDCGTITVTDGETDTRLNWRSLGAVKTPGRLFRITDTGALTRIDSIEMEDGA